MAPSIAQVDDFVPNGNGIPKSAKPLHTNGVSKPEFAIPEPNLAAKRAAAQLDASYKIVERPIGTRRRIRIVCMGAGYSGLMMGMVFNQRLKDKNAELVIYERNEDLGGTWLENRYVYIRCDRRCI